MCSIGQLICEYYNCTDEAHCVYGYEVCSENPFYGGDDYYVCVAVLNRLSDKLQVLYKGCFIMEYGCNDTCVLEEYPKDYYSCCCNSTLCNNDIYNNDSLIAPSNYTPVIKPTGK